MRAGRIGGQQVDGARVVNGAGICVRGCERARRDRCKDDVGKWFVAACKDMQWWHRRRARVWSARVLIGKLSASSSVTLSFCTRAQNSWIDL